MELWNVGDKSEAMCGACRERRATTFAVCDVPLGPPSVVARGVLAAVCDVCGSVAAIPAQSAPRLREALERSPTKVIARINRRLEDGVLLIADQVGAHERAFGAMLVRYYLRAMREHESVARRVARSASHELARGPKTGRIEFRIPESELTGAWEIARTLGLRTQTQLVEGIIVTAIEDVLEERAPRRTSELELVAALA